MNLSPEKPRCSVFEKAQSHADDNPVERQRLKSTATGTLKQFRPTRRADVWRDLRVSPPFEQLGQV
jgi:hypothetical protein